MTDTLRDPQEIDPSQQMSTETEELQVGVVDGALDDGGQHLLIEGDVPTTRAIDTVVTPDEAEKKWYQTTVARVVGGTVAVVGAGVAVATFAFGGGSESDSNAEGNPAPAAAEANGEQNEADPGAPVIIDSGAELNPNGSEVTDETREAASQTPTAEVSTGVEWVEGTPKPLEGNNVSDITNSFAYNMEQAMLQDNQDFLRTMGIDDTTANPNIEQMWDLFYAFGSEQGYDTSQHSYILSDVAVPVANDDFLEITASEEISIAPWNTGGKIETGSSDVVIRLELSPDTDTWIVSDIFRPVVRQSVGSISPNS